MLLRSRHQSGPQEPQSTTMNPPTPRTPLTPQSMNFNQPPTPTQSVPSMRQLLSSPSPNAADPQTSKGATSAAGSVSSLCRKLDKPITMQDKNLDNILQLMWEKGNDDPYNPSPNKGVKRKTPPCEISDIKEDQDPLAALTGSSSSFQGQQDAQNQQGNIKTLQKNELLKRLLSKQSEKETKIFTQLPMGNSNPCDNPQQRFQCKNLQEKILIVKRNEKVKDDDKNVKMDTDMIIKNDNSSSLSGQNVTLSSILNSNKLSSNRGYGQNVNPSPDQFELGGFSNNPSSSMDAENTGDNSDSLLEQILQQAVDLHQDINSGNIRQPENNNNNSSSGSGLQLQQTNANDDNILNQLELVLGDSGFSEIDRMLGISNDGSIRADANDKLAIEAIQKQLMSEESVQPQTPNTSLPQASMSQSSQSFTNQGQMFQQTQPSPQQQAMNQLSPAAGNMDLAYRIQQQQMASRTSLVDIPPQQTFNQAASTNFGGQGVRQQGTSYNFSGSY